MSQSIIVIPARLAATRLPNKPLIDIAGTPMIIRVMQQARAANLGPTIVACGDQEIVDIVEKNGGTALLTDPGLPSGTDRVHAALEQFDPKGHFTHIINLQGDLPTINPEYLNITADLLNTNTYDIVTLASPITTEEEKQSPHVVKAALSLNPDCEYGKAIYFSRMPLTCGPNDRMYHHIGIYGFKRQALNKFVAMPPGPLEQHEKLEQLRALENGMSIGVYVVPFPPFGVDSPADLEKICLACAC